MTTTATAQRMGSLIIHIVRPDSAATYCQQATYGMAVRVATGSERGVCHACTRAAESVSAVR